jgi:hypothetical protein
MIGPARLAAYEILSAVPPAVPTFRRRLRRSATLHDERDRSPRHRDRSCDGAALDHLIAQLGDPSSGSIAKWPGSSAQRLPAAHLTRARVGRGRCRGLDAADGQAERGWSCQCSDDFRRRDALPLARPLVRRSRGVLGRGATSHPRWLVARCAASGLDATEPGFASTIAGAADCRPTAQATPRELVDT